MFIPQPLGIVLQDHGRHLGVSGLVQERFDEPARVIILLFATVGDAQPGVSDRAYLLRLFLMLVDTHSLSDYLLGI